MKKAYSGREKEQRARLAIQKSFKNRTPPGTWVYQRDEDHFLYGKTTQDPQGQDIYQNLDSDYVLVTNVLGRKGVTERWSFEDVVNLKPEEGKERLLPAEDFIQAKQPN